MARLTRKQAAERAQEHCADAIEALGRRDYEQGREFCAAALGQVSAIIATPVNVQRVPADTDDRRFSGSLQTGLSILSLFVDDNVTLGIADVADALHMSRSTTHRYMITLVLVGQLEQTVGRKYRRPQIGDVEVSAA